jgi:hypothetical protein
MRGVNVATINDIVTDRRGPRVLPIANFLLIAPGCLERQLERQRSERRRALKTLLLRSGEGGGRG